MKIIKKCKYHGELNIDQVYSYSRTKQNGKIYERKECKLCSYMRAKRLYYEKKQIQSKKRG